MHSTWCWKPFFENHVNIIASHSLYDWKYLDTRSYCPYLGIPQTAAIKFEERKKKKTLVWKVYLCCSIKIFFLLFKPLTAWWVSVHNHKPKPSGMPSQKRTAAMLAKGGTDINAYGLAKRFLLHVSTYFLSYNGVVAGLSVACPRCESSVLPHYMLYWIQICWLEWPFKATKRIVWSVWCFVLDCLLLNDTIMLVGSVDSCCLTPNSDPDISMPKYKSIFVIPGDVLFPIFTFPLSGSPV